VRVGVRMERGAGLLGKGSSPMRFENRRTTDHHLRDGASTPLVGVKRFIGQHAYCAEKICRGISNRCGIGVRRSDYFRLSGFALIPGGAAVSRNIEDLLPKYEPLTFTTATSLPTCRLTAYSKHFELTHPSRWFLVHRICCSCQMLIKTALSATCGIF